jgi:hypothetical protein
MMASAAKIGSKGIDVAENLATQRVIGYTKSVTYRKGKKNPKLIQENINIGVQAWEIGLILAGVAAYEYVNGAGSLMPNLGDAFLTRSADVITPGNPLNRLGAITTTPLTVGMI